MQSGFFPDVIVAESSPGSVFKLQSRKYYALLIWRYSCLILYERLCLSYGHNGADIDRERLSCQIFDKDLSAPVFSCVPDVQDDRNNAWKKHLLLFPLLIF